MILGSSPNTPISKYKSYILLMHPLNIYFKEILWRVFYCILSLILVFTVSFHYIEFIFLFEIFPLIRLSHQKFIATHITELFDSVLQTCFFMVSINGFPLISYHILTFFTSGWFNYQVTLMWRYLFILLLFVFLSFLFTNDESNTAAPAIAVRCKNSLRDEASKEEVLFVSIIYNFLFYKYFFITQSL